jgi:hypothetical protein
MKTPVPLRVEKRTLQGTKYPAYPSLRITARVLREKIQNPNYRGTRD